MVQAHAPFPHAPSDVVKPWPAYLERSRYFLIAVLVHLVILLLVATIVIFPGFRSPPEAPMAVVHLSPAPIVVTPPPVDPHVPNLVSSGGLSGIDVISGGSHPFVPPEVPKVNVQDLFKQAGPNPDVPRITVRPNQPSDQRTKEIVQTVAGWSPIGEALNSPGDIKGRHANFAIYLAKYADGDWSCNTILRDGKIAGGSLMNLSEKISQWSHGRLTGTVVPEPLDIASPELLNRPPPFIFFTGHKDFHLTDQEVQNLREYLQVGGCIWGDSALAGQGSRFDVAFHREMARVVGDQVHFQTTTMADPIFTKSWYPMDHLPSGMNYYAEPIQHLDLDGRLAILYTPNDYADMLTMRLEPGDAKIAPDWVPDDATSFLQTDGTFLHHNEIFFRNYDLKPCLACHQLGMNVVSYLLVRFDDLVQLSPP